MAWQFNGIDSAAYISSGAHTTFPAEGYSVSFWFKIIGSGVTAHQQFFFHRSGSALSDTNSLSIRIAEATHIMAAVGTDTNGNNSINLSNPAVTGEYSNSGWVHCVLTRSRNISSNVTTTSNDDSNYSSLYLQGQLQDVDSRTGTIYINQGHLVFGKRGNGSSNLTLSGNLAEFAKWDRVISPREIQRLYNGHSPEFMRPVFYFPMRNDYVDRVLNITGVSINNVAIVADHPVGHRVYIPDNEVTDTFSNLVDRVGNLETRGYIDFVSYSPGTIAPSGYAQSALFFSQARVGEAYAVAGNASLSGCMASAQCDTSGSLTITVRNPSAATQNVQATSWRVYKL